VGVLRKYSVHMTNTCINELLTTAFVLPPKICFRALFFDLSRACIVESSAALTYRGRSRRTNPTWCSRLCHEIAVPPVPTSGPITVTAPRHVRQQADESDDSGCSRLRVQ
jgi:hypothetical protein